MDTIRNNSFWNHDLVRKVKDRPQYFLTIKPDGLHAYYGGFCAFIVGTDFKAELFSKDYDCYVKYIPEGANGDNLIGVLHSKITADDKARTVVLNDAMLSALENAICNYSEGRKTRAIASAGRKPAKQTERITQQIIAQNCIRNGSFQYTVFDIEFAVPGSGSKPECDLIAVTWQNGEPTIAYIEYKCTIGALKKDGPEVPATVTKHWEAMRSYINSRAVKATAWEQYSKMSKAGLVDCAAMDKLEYYDKHIDKIDTEALFLFVKTQDQIKNYVYKRVSELDISDNDNVRFAYFDCVDDIVWDRKAFLKREAFLRQLS